MTQDEYNRQTQYKQFELRQGNIDNYLGDANVQHLFSTRRNGIVSWEKYILNRYDIRVHLDTVSLDSVQELTSLVLARTKGYGINSIALTPRMSDSENEDVLTMLGITESIRTHRAQYPSQELDIAIYVEDETQFDEYNLLIQRVFNLNEVERGE